MANFCFQMIIFGFTMANFSFKTTTWSLQMAILKFQMANFGFQMTNLNLQMAICNSKSLPALPIVASWVVLRGPLGLAVFFHKQPLSHIKNLAKKIWACHFGKFGDQNLPCRTLWIGRRRLQTSPSRNQCLFKNSKNHFVSHAGASHLKFRV